MLMLTLNERPPDSGSYFMPGPIVINLLMVYAMVFLIPLIYSKFNLKGNISSA